MLVSHSFNRVALLARLIGKRLSGESGSKDRDAFKTIASEFDKARLEMCGLAVKEARMEGSYGRVENSLMRSFMRIGKWLNPSSTWAVTPFETLVRRGGCFVYEPSFAPGVKEGGDEEKEEEGDKEKKEEVEEVV
jgi:hypothetical protein